MGMDPLPTKLLKPMYPIMDPLPTYGSISTFVRRILESVFGGKTQ